MSYQKLQKLNILSKIKYDANERFLNDSDETQRINFTMRLRVVFLTTRRPERVSFKILLDGELIIDGDIIILAEEAIAENGVDQLKSDNKLRHMSQNRHKDGLTENIFVLVDGKDTGGQIIHKPTVSGSDSKVLLKHRVKIRFNLLNLRNFVAGPDFLRPRHVFNPHKLCQKSEIKKILQTY
eukprot:jgi/Bigna1/88611/estExt_fgenesh1_pg.C_350012